jgi:hypothetical protein
MFPSLLALDTVCRIQRILRHANVNTTATYYIETAVEDVKHAIEKLENHIPEAKQTVRDTNKITNHHKQPIIQPVQ